MAPKQGRSAKKAVRNVTNPELSQVPPVNVEPNLETNVVPSENLEMNTVPPVNPEMNTVPPAGASRSELNEAMIAQIVREQLSACGVLTQHQPHITAGSGGDHDHIEHNATGGHTKIYHTTGTTTTKVTVPDPPLVRMYLQIWGMVTAAEPITLKRTILLTTKLTDEVVRSGTLIAKTQTTVGRRDVGNSNVSKGTKQKWFGKIKTKARLRLATANEM
ncbi:hypothetical protein E3N88_23557 [Mikania micrantha]|uniref:Uncharacterized protein n=1 Tax=Mikania micrantha TaxID=192012 RepID=A0A5N6NDL1_9ASTR|nr:hypothetical protein E3N88_23557 [Mikania micrantha]